MPATPRRSLDGLRSITGAYGFNQSALSTTTGDFYGPAANLPSITIAPINRNSSLPPISAASISPREFYAYRETWFTNRRA